jgi:hypothetical protein
MSTESTKSPTKTNKSPTTTKKTPNNTAKNRADSPQPEDEFDMITSDDTHEEATLIHRDEIKESYVNISSDGPPSAGELERVGKPYGTPGSVAVEGKESIYRTDKAREARKKGKEVQDGFVELPADDTEVDEDGDPVARG